MTVRKTKTPEADDLICRITSGDGGVNPSAVLRVSSLMRVHDQLVVRHEFLCDTASGSSVTGSEVGVRTSPLHGLCACTVALAAACASAADEGIGLEPVEDQPSTSEGSTDDPPDTPGGLVADPDLATAIPPVDGVVYVETDLPRHAEGCGCPPPPALSVGPWRSTAVPWDS